VCSHVRREAAGISTNTSKTCYIGRKISSCGANNHIEIGLLRVKVADVRRNCKLTFLLFGVSSGFLVRQNVHVFNIYQLCLRGRLLHTSLFGEDVGYGGGFFGGKNRLNVRHLLYINGLF
jgi:hypothetical protein